MYSSASSVAFLTPNLLSSSSNFTADTTPTITAVEFWLSSACGHMETLLNSKGFATPVAVSGIRDNLAAIETLYGAAMAEMSRANVRLGPGERTRGQVFMEMFDDQLEALLKTDLTLAGVGSLGTAPLYAGGISSSDKSTIEGDSDRVKPVFKRELMRFPGTTDAGSIERDDD